MISHVSPLGKDCVLIDACDLTDILSPILKLEVSIFLYVCTP